MLSSGTYQHYILRSVQSGRRLLALLTAILLPGSPGHQESKPRFDSYSRPMQNPPIARRGLLAADSNIVERATALARDAAVVECPMATIEELIERLPVILDPHRLRIEGGPRVDMPSDGYQIGLRTDDGVRVVLGLTEECVVDAVDGIAVADLVERSDVLPMLAGAETTRVLGIRSDGKLFEPR